MVVSPPARMNRPGFPMAPILSRTGVSGKPGAVQVVDDPGLGALSFRVPDALGKLQVADDATVAVTPLGGPHVHA